MSCYALSFNHSVWVYSACYSNGRCVFLLFIYLQLTKCLQMRCRETKWQAAIKTLDFCTKFNKWRQSFKKSFFPAWKKDLVMFLLTPLSNLVPRIHKVTEWCLINCFKVSNFVSKLLLFILILSHFYSKFPHF